MGLFSFLKKKSQADKDLETVMADIAKKVFPEGISDIQRHAKAVRAIFHNKLTVEESERFVQSSKTLVFIAKDKTAERIVPSLMNRASNKVTDAEAYEAYIYLSEGGLSYSGGDGLSKDTPVVISAMTSAVGIPAEYAYIEKTFGKENEDWTLELRMHGKNPTGRVYEIFSLVLKDGRKVSVHFDITSFFGKF